MRGWVSKEDVWFERQTDVVDRGYTPARRSNGGACNASCSPPARSCCCVGGATLVSCGGVSWVACKVDVISPFYIIGVVLGGQNDPPADPPAALQEYELA